MRSPGVGCRQPRVQGVLERATRGGGSEEMLSRRCHREGEQVETGQQEWPCTLSRARLGVLWWGQVVGIISVCGHRDMGKKNHTSEHSHVELARVRGGAGLRSRALARRAPASWWSQYIPSRRPGRTNQPLRHDSCCRECNPFGHCLAKCRIGPPSMLRATPHNFVQANTFALQLLRMLIHCVPAGLSAS